MSKKQVQKVEVRESGFFKLPFSRRSQGGVPKVKAGRHGDHRVPKAKPRRPVVG